MQTERDFMAQVRELARLRGWRVYHTYDSRRSEPGFPDLVLVRDRLLFVELKSDEGSLTPRQREWIEALLAARAEVWVWRPRDWDELEEELR